MHLKYNKNTQKTQLQTLGIISPTTDSFQYKETNVLSEYNTLAKLLVKQKHISKKNAKKETHNIIKDVMHKYNLNSKIEAVLKAIELFQN